MELVLALEIMLAVLVFGTIAFVDDIVDALRGIHPRKEPFQDDWDS